MSRREFRQWTHFSFFPGTSFLHRLYYSLKPNCFSVIFSGLYALINNAGVCVCGEFDWQTWDQIQAQVDVNLLGTLRVTKHCLPLLKAGEGKSIQSFLVHFIALRTINQLSSYRDRRHPKSKSQSQVSRGPSLQADYWRYYIGKNTTADPFSSCGMV